MQNKSLWLKDNDNSDKYILNKDLDLDILIIGGGITGLSTLYNLRNSNKKIALLEASTIGSGSTGHTTGKINYLQELIYQEIENKYDYQVAKKYYESQKDAIKFITGTIRNEKIKCDLEVVDSYVYTDNLEDVPKIKREKEILEKMGVKVLETTNNIDFIQSKYAIKVQDTYVFHPLKYLQALKKICLKNGKMVYENSKVVRIEEKDNVFICYTEDYTVKCQKLIIASLYPFFLFPYVMPLKCTIEKSYIGASLTNAKNYTLITSSKPTTSVRYQKDRQEYLIYLTESSQICDNLDEKENYGELIKELNDLKLSPSYVWKNTDLLTIDKIPYIGYLNKKHNLLIGTGYNTWGMTNGSLAGLILSDLVLNKKNKYMSLCDPLRVNITDLGGILTNIYSNIKGFIKSKIGKNKKWYENVSFETKNGISIGIYKENDKVYKVYNRCPHLGCSLIFNEEDKTWDCPCHASRFDKKGKCIKGPSQYDITYKDNK